MFEKQKLAKSLTVKKLEVPNKIKVTPPFLSCRFAVVQRAECLPPHCSMLDHLLGGGGTNKGLRTMVKQTCNLVKNVQVPTVEIICFVILSYIAYNDEQLRFSKQYSYIILKLIMIQSVVNKE